MLFVVLHPNRREECANRPRHEFVPKTLTDLAIDEHGSVEAGINGGRFRHPSNSFSSHSSSSRQYNQHHAQQHSRTDGGLHRAGSSNRPHNNGHHHYPANGGTGSQANRNIYSSQQNLSKHSSYGRNRTFGSQQSLNNAAGGAAGGANGGAGGYNHASNNNGNDTTDVWLNAWSSPPAVAAAPAPFAGTVLNGAASSHNNGNGNRTSANSGHSKKSLFSDPWTG